MKLYHAVFLHLIVPLSLLVYADFSYKLFYDIIQPKLCVAKHWLLSIVRVLFNSDVALPHITYTLG